MGHRITAVLVVEISNLSERMKHFSLILLAAIFGLSMAGCGNNAKDESPKDSIAKVPVPAAQTLDTVSKDTVVKEVPAAKPSPAPAPKPQSTVNSWHDVAQIVGKHFKVIGIYKGTMASAPTLILYKKDSRTYLTTCHMSEEPIHHEFAYQLRKLSSTTYQYSEPGDDMPERFVVDGNTLETYTYNPDMGEWVFMGDYWQVY